ncbi:MAG: hypothetical protein L6R37_003105 [Teloschistes peruensis]|nr:MAG: hypothetical protein L6R37_003105 [Teloschistes peruensis]
MTDAARSRTFNREAKGFDSSSETASSSMNSPYATKNAAISPPSPLQLPSAVEAEAEAHVLRKSPSGAVADMTSSTTCLRPSPEADEEVQPPEDYATIQRGKISVPQLQEFPAPPTSMIPRASLENMSHAPTTSSSSATTPAANQFTVPSSAKETQRGIYAYPPGYMQNPYAMEATVEQRLAAELEGEDEESLPAPNLSRTRRLSAASSLVEGGLVGLLKKARRNTIDLIEGVREWTGDIF